MTIKNNADYHNDDWIRRVNLASFLDRFPRYLTIKANNKGLKANKRIARSIVDSRIRPGALPARPMWPNFSRA